MRSKIFIPIMLLAGAAALADERRIERRVAAEPTGTVAIANVAGRIDVIGWDRSEVEVRGTIDSDVQRVDVTREGARTLVKVVLPRGSGRGADADLVVRVPRASALEVSAVSADVETRDVHGAQRLNTVSGNVRTQLAKADAQIKTVSGDVVLRGRTQPLAARVKTVSGNVSYEDGAGSLEVETVSGDVQVELDPVTVLRVNTTSGNLGLRGALAPDARIDVQTMSGDLSLAARAARGLKAEVETFSGDIRTCFEARPERSSRYGPGERLSATTGEGGAQVRLKSFSGDVRLCDR